MSLTLFYINACYLNKHFDDLEHMLSNTSKYFDKTAITENRITKYVSLTNNLTINHFPFKFTSTESLPGATLLYIGNHLSYKTCSDLNIYKSSELESTFIEILNHKKSNTAIRCFYKHHSMDHYKNTNDLNNLLDKISKEKKSVFTLDDFDVNLLHYNNHDPTNEFFDSLATNSLYFTTNSTNFPL